MATIEQGVCILAEVPHLACCPEVEDVTAWGDGTYFRGVASVFLALNRRLPAVVNGVLKLKSRVKEFTSNRPLG